MHSSKSRSLKQTGKRSFTINNVYHVDGCPTKFSYKDYTGRYLKHTAQRAASQALSRLCAVKRIRGQCTLYIEMRETTQGSSGKLYAYHAKRIHLKTPIEYKTPDGTIVKKYYINKVKPVDNVPTDKCPKSHKSSGSMISYHSKKLHKKLHRSHKSKSKSKSLTKKMTNTMRKTVASIKKSVKNMM